MATTPQSQLVTLANQMCASLQSFRSALQTVIDLRNQYTNLEAGTGFAALPTCAVNADGSLGAADSTPDTVTQPLHVIDNRVVSALDVAIASYNLGVVNDILGAFQALFEGNPVTTQNYAPAMLAATASDQR